LIAHSGSLTPRRGVQFGLGSVLPHSNTPSLRVAGFEDSGSTELAEVLSAVAHVLWCHPLKVGLATYPS